MREKNVLNPASFSGFVQRGVHVFTRTKRVQLILMRESYIFFKNKQILRGDCIYIKHMESHTQVSYHLLVLSYHKTHSQSLGRLF